MTESTNSVDNIGVITDDVAAFRRFNRMYTRFLGTLDEHLLDSPFSLAQARALYEVANRISPKAKEIAEELGMDSGYLSRILSKFEQDGLLKRTTSKQDARHAELTLTAQGKSAFRKLNALSESQGRTVLERHAAGHAIGVHQQLTDGRTHSE